jgi:hypothetical protein
MQQDQSWPIAQAAWTVAVKKIPHVQQALVKSQGAQGSLAPVHQSTGSMYI